MYYQQKGRPCSAIGSLILMGDGFGNRVTPKNTIPVTSIHSLETIENRTQTLLS